MELSPDRALQIIDRCRYLADAGLLTAAEAAEFTERLRRIVEQAETAATLVSARGPTVGR